MIILGKSEHSKLDLFTSICGGGTHFDNSQLKAQMRYSNSENRFV